MQTFNIQVALLVSVVAVVFPTFLRVVSSPLTLLLVSPFILLSIAVGFLALNVILGYVLDTTRARPPNPLPNVARPFAFSTPAAWQAVMTRTQWSHKPPQSLAPLYPESPVISAALNEILIMIVRDFVLTWYKDISSSPSFPTAVSSTLHSSLERILSRAAHIDMPSLMVNRILPKITTHIEQFRQSEVALRGAGLERRLTQSEELDILLASKYASMGSGKLHPAVVNLSSTFTRQTEEEHLRQLVQKALPFILPDNEAGSPTVKIVVREIVACTVLYPVMEMLSDPDFWNRTIDQVAGAAIRQQRLVSKVRNVLEAQIPAPNPRVQAPRSATTEAITIRTDARQFESFLRSINRCASLLDARRLKNDIMGEIRRTRMLLANHEKDDWIDGEKTEDVVSYLDRLYTAKRKVEQRIVVLGGEDDSIPMSSEAPTTQRLSLRDVLTNPSSLSYLMEFMDRRNRSLLVQFWLTVESFKNPLESIDSDSSEDEDEPIQNSRSDTVKEDITMINDLYFSGPTPHQALAAISVKHINAIRAFALGEFPSTPSSERKVRRNVMLAQRQVERDMEGDFEDLQRSELWFRVLGDTASSRLMSSPVPSKAQSPTNTIGRKLGQDAITRRGQSPILLSPPIIPRNDSLPSLRVSFDPDAGSESRSSFDTSQAPRAGPSKLDLLMSPVSDASESSRAPLFDESDSAGANGDEAQLQRMEAIEAALTDIIALDNQQGDKPKLARVASEPLSELGSGFVTSAHGTGKTSIGFDDELEGDEDRNEEHDTASQGSFQIAGPGDLQLTYEIARLSDKLSNLQSQDIMLDRLIKKAELTGDTQESRLLQKSQSALNREIRELSFQKTQYEQQESANRLVSERTKLAIVNSTVGDEVGKAVVRYIVEVQQLASDGSFATGWVVARRYNEFLSMHNRLRDKYAVVRTLDFPGKRIVTGLSGHFVDTRRAALEKYMQSLIADPAVCESEELRAFLSRESPLVATEPSNTASRGSTPFPGKGLVRTVYQSVAESIDDMFFGPSMLDVIIQRLTSQAAEFAGIVGSAIHDEDLVTQALKASGKSTTEDALMHLTGDLKPLDGETSTSTFSAPICDLVLAIFELNKKNNWLRRQAIVIILQQVLGDTVERKIRDTFKSFLEETQMVSLTQMFRDSLWPGGQLRASSVPRTSDEKDRTRDEANRKLSALIPDLAANMIGRSNARRGARRMFAVLQNRRLNQHIMYTIVDEVFSALFTDV